MRIPTIHQELYSAGNLISVERMLDALAQVRIGSWLTPCWVGRVGVHETYNEARRAPLVYVL